MRTHQLIPLMLVFLLVGCSAILDDGGEPIPFEVIEVDSPHNLTNEFLDQYGSSVVIRTEDEWSAYWDLKYQRYEDPPAGEPREIPERPSIDFDDNQIIALHYVAPTGGHDLTLDRIWQKDDEITVDAIRTVPGPDCMVTQAIVHHVVLAEFPATDKPVDVTWSEDTRTC